MEASSGSYINVNKRKPENEPFTSRTRAKVEASDAMVTDDEVSITALPEELLLKIFSFFLAPSYRSDFESVLDISSLPLVCRDWKRISDDESLWFLFYKIFFFR